MQYYLIIGKPKEALKEALPLFEQKAAYSCAGSIVESTPSFSKVFQDPPNLVLVDLDTGFDVYEIIEKLNASVGIIPNYIGFTSSTVYGFNAFKKGFLDVILAPFSSDNVLSILLKYNKTFIKNPLFCIETHHDFQYINLADVVLLKADRYITEFVLKDGSVINSYKNLKSTHNLLPAHFQRIHRGCVINALYVYRIYSGKQQLYLRHCNGPLRFSKKYSHNILQIKKILTSLSIPS